MSGVSRLGNCGDSAGLSLPIAIIKSEAIVSPRFPLLDEKSCPQCILTREKRPQIHSIRYFLSCIGVCVSVCGEMTVYVCLSLWVSVWRIILWRTEALTCQDMACISPPLIPQAIWPLVSYFCKSRSGKMTVYRQYFGKSLISWCWLYCHHSHPFLFPSSGVPLTHFLCRILIAIPHSLWLCVPCAPPWFVPGVGVRTPRLGTSRFSRPSSKHCW